MFGGKVKQGLRDFAEKVRAEIANLKNFTHGQELIIRTSDYSTDNKGSQ